MKLSRITKVNPREIWKHEAHDFTQWLSKDENIEILCEELELNLENIKPEAMEYFLERFASSLGSVMVSWGFAFMEDFDLKLIPKK